jgi:hypothetical protein
MARAEQDGIPFLFKLRLTRGVKKTIERLIRARPALACPGEITRGTPATRTARAPRPVVDDSSLPSRAPRGRRTARDRGKLARLG